MEKRRNTEVIKSLVPLAGAAVIDIGCGQGALTRWLAKQNAEPVGIDCGAAAVAMAKAAGLQVLVGDATALPVASASFDVAIILNSLHHFPDPSHTLVEARRVLRDGGKLLVVEPLAAGPYFRFMQPVDDETNVRASALQALASAGPHGFKPEAQLDYAYDVLVDELERELERWVLIDPARSDLIASNRVELARRFAEEGVPHERGRTFTQPMRAFLFEATA